MGVVVLFPSLFQKILNRSEVNKVNRSETVNVEDKFITQNVCEVYVLKTRQTNGPVSIRKHF